MPVCSSGISQPKSISPAVAFLTGESLTAIAVEALGLPAVWASLLAYAVGQTVTTSTLCASDPPAMPSFTGADIAAIVTGVPQVSPAAYGKLADLITIAAWYTFCECASVTTPSPPAAPTYPTTGPIVNPPGQITPLSTIPCWDKQIKATAINSTLIPLDPSFPPPPPNKSGGALYIENTGATAIEVTLTNNADGTVNGAGNYRLRWFSSTGTLLQNNDSGSIGMGVTSGPTIVVPPANWEQCTWQWNSPAIAGLNNTVTARCRVWCTGTGPTAPNSPCCPPDPNLTAQLQSVRNMLDLIYSALPTPLTSYAEGTVHSGLTGDGSITLVDEAIAVKVTITTDQPAYGLRGGHPDFLFDRGYIVPFNSEGPVYRQDRLVFNPQIITLPPLSDSVGYSISAGVAISITELTAGP